MFDALEMCRTATTTRRGPYIVVIALLTLLVWFFGRAFVAGDVVAFRDAGNFYYPLFAWECGQWNAGRIPLWNPHDNCGTPLLADTSSSVLYPGKIVFALPMDFARRFNLYVILHFLLAACGAYRLARGLQATAGAGGLCAVAYTFSGSVLFEHTNVIYLVGAAWLPWALFAAERMLAVRSWRWAVACGVILACMILGGDPQAAYHTVLLIGLGILILTHRLASGGELIEPRERVESARSPATEPPVAIPSAALRRQPGLWRRGRGRNALPSPALSGVSSTRLRIIDCRWVLLVIASASAFALAGVQLIPAFEWARRSERAVYRFPRNVYEAGAYVRDVATSRRSPPASGTVASSVCEGLIGRPEPNTHHEQIYRFSVGPWRLIELVCPNVTGSMFPIHRRWISLIPAEGRAWSPSLYLGLLPIVLALGSWQVRRAPVRVAWVSWFTLLAALGSFGWYGLGWLVHEVLAGGFGMPAERIWIGPPVGGIYWLLVVMLPGYAMFRYPAKLWIVASLGLSLLAARGWDGLWISNAAKLRRALAAISLGGLLATLAALVCRPVLSGLFSAAPPDNVFGPLDGRGAAAEVCQALAHTTCVGGLLWAALWLARPGQVPRSSGRCGAGILFCAGIWGTVADLMIAHCGLVPTVPGAMVREASLIADAARGSPTGFHRVFRASPRGWQPASWLRSSSPSRLLEVVEWERSTLVPRHHLVYGLPFVEAQTTLTSHDFRMFLKVAREFGVRRADGLAEPHPEALDAMSAEYLILPEPLYSGAPSDNELIPLPQGASGLQDVVLVRRQTAFPKAWIVHRARSLPPLETNDPWQVEQRTREVVFPNGSPADLRHVATLEGAGPIELSDVEEGTRESSRVVRYSPECVEIEVEMAGGGLLVLNDLYYPGWRAEVSGDARQGSLHPPVLRANRVMRAVPLSAGRHRVTFRYRPASFAAGLLLSILGWSAALALGATCLSARRRPPINAGRLSCCSK